MPNWSRSWGLNLIRKWLHFDDRLGVIPPCQRVIAPERIRTAIQLENIALRHQIGVLQRSVKRPRLNSADRLLWVWLSRVWTEWRSSLVIVKPATVIAWHRKAFRMFWTWKIGRGKRGRPAVARDTRDLIRRMSRENPGWGAPRIHGELLKLGIDIGETQCEQVPCADAQAALPDLEDLPRNHLKTLVSVDFFSAPQGRRSPVGEGPTQVVVGRT